MMEASSEIHSQTHWSDYYSTPYQACPSVESETPFFGTKIWKTLTDIQKKKLELGFRQINAEVIIHLEQGLLVSARALYAQGLKEDKALREFVQDELTHIAAFRDYLHLEFNGDFRSHSLLLFKKDLYRKIAYRLFQWEPLCVFLPGAKSEIYAIQYFVELRKKSKELNPRWYKLIQLHAQDEVSHIQSDFDLLKSQLTQMSFFRLLKLHIATMASVMLTQWSLGLTAFRLVDKVFYEKSLVKKLQLTFSLASWVLWKHNAFPQTRKVFSTYLQKENAMYFKNFAFLGW